MLLPEDDRGPPYSGFFTILSATKYRSSSGKTYSYSYAKKRVKFKSGPYKGWVGRYSKKQGDHVISVYNKQGYVMTCSN